MNTRNRTVAMRVAQRIEEMLKVDIDHRIKYGQMLKLARRACREEGCEPGTAHAAVTLLEYCDYLRADLGNNTTQPIEYLIHGRRWALSQVPTEQLLKELGKRAS